MDAVYIISPCGSGWKENKQNHGLFHLCTFTSVDAFRVDRTVSYRADVSKGAEQPAGLRKSLLIRFEAETILLFPVLQMVEVPVTYPMMFIFHLIFNTALD